MDLTILEANRSHCPELGLGAHLLSKALAISRQSYELVPMRNVASEGALNVLTGRWTGMLPGR